jgi:hypothetical protein
LCNFLTLAKAQSVTIYNVGTSPIVITGGNWALSSGVGSSNYVYSPAPGTTTVTAGTSRTVNFSWPVGYWGSGGSVVLITPFGNYTLGDESTSTFSVSLNSGTGILQTNYLPFSSNTNGSVHLMSYQRKDGTKVIRLIKIKHK